MFVKGGKPGPGRTPVDRSHVPPEVKAIEAQRTSRKRRAGAVLAIDNPGMPLRPWMKLTALWIAQQPKRPKKRDLLMAARGFVKCRITMADVNRMLLRPDFQREVETLLGEVEAQAKATFISQMVSGIETHHQAMTRLMERGEYKEVAKFTAPYIERAYPTKQERGPATPTIVINLGNSEFQKRYLEAPPDQEEIVIEANEVTVIEAT